MKIENCKLKISSKGFSLVEGLVAATILVVGILGVVQLFPAGFKATKISKEETTASNIGQAKMEQILSQPYSEISYETRTKWTYDYQSPYYDYETQVDVIFVDSDLNESPTDTGLKKITVTIFWPTNESLVIESMKSSSG